MSIATELVTRAFNAQQDADELHRVERFTGVEWDRITHDYAVWLHGRIVGWVPTYHQGEEHLAKEVMPNATHATVSAKNTPTMRTHRRG